MTPRQALAAAPYALRAVQAELFGTVAQTSGSNTLIDGGPSLPDVGQYNAISIGLDGNPVISYYDMTNGNLKVAKCANPACTGTAVVTTVDNSANNVGRYSSITVPVDGLPVISWCRQHRQVPEGRQSVPTRTVAAARRYRRSIPVSTRACTPQSQSPVTACRWWPNLSAMD